MFTIVEIINLVGLSPIQSYHTKSTISGMRKTELFKQMQ